MKTSTIVWIIVLILIIAAGWYLYSVRTASLPLAPSEQAQTTGTASTGTNTGTNTSAGAGSQVPMSMTVKLASTGFFPGTVTVRKGGTVTWINESGSPMWVASAMHPTHELYDGTSKDAHCDSDFSGPAPFDQCSSGASYGFTFNKAGTWKYHNHVNSSQFGTVIVQ